MSTHQQSPARQVNLSTTTAPRSGRPISFEGYEEWFLLARTRGATVTGMPGMPASHVRMLVLVLAASFPTQLHALEMDQGLESTRKTWLGSGLLALDWPNISCYCYLDCELAVGRSFLFPSLHQSLSFREISLRRRKKQNKENGLWVWSLGQWGTA